MKFNRVFKLNSYKFIKMKTPSKKEKQVDELKVQDKLVDVAKESKLVKKKPKAKKLKTTKVAADNAVAVEIKESMKNLSVADIAKIEKKKAKKQAQKLKKQQKKSEPPATKENAPKEEAKTAAKTNKKENGSLAAGAEENKQSPTNAKPAAQVSKKEKKATKKSKHNNNDTGKYTHVAF